MHSPAAKSIPVIIILAIIAALLPMGALADPYPGGVHVVPYDMNTIRVVWEPNSHADRYRVYRNGTLIAEPNKSTSEYDDSAFPAGTSLWYSVATVEDGLEYLTGPVPAAWTIPLTAPVLEVTDWFKDYYDAVFGADLAWNHIEGATGYEVHVSKNSGPWEELLTAYDEGVSTELPLTGSVQSYSFKVRAYNKFWYVVTDEHHKTEGPFSEAVTVSCIHIDLGPWIEMIRPWKWPPWPDPWQQEWLLPLLAVYGDADKWPADAGGEELAELAKCLLEGVEPSEAGKLIREALHPHGLALLLGAYETPPDRETARKLADGLQKASQLMAGQALDDLEGKSLKGYLEDVKGLFSLVGLAGEAGDNLESMRVLRPSDSRIILSAPNPVATDMPRPNGPIILFRLKP